MAESGKVIRTRRAVEKACMEGAKLFAAKGYSETTTRELASAMDVTNGTFYYYFPTKEDLLRQICENALAEITAAATKAVDDAPAGIDAVTLLIHAHIGTVLASVQAHTTMLTELRALSGEHRESVIAARSRYEQLVRRVLIEAQVAGALDTKIEVEVLTLLLLNLLNWTIFWYRPEMKLSADEIADRMVTLFLRGAEPPPERRTNARASGVKLGDG